MLKLNALQQYKVTSSSNRSERYFNRNISTDCKVFSNDYEVKPTEALKLLNAANHNLSRNEFEKLNIFLLKSIILSPLHHYLLKLRDAEMSLVKKSKSLKRYSNFILHGPSEDPIELILKESDRYGNARKFKNRYIYYKLSECSGYNSLLKEALQGLQRIKPWLDYNTDNLFIKERKYYSINSRVICKYVHSYIALQLMIVDLSPMLDDSPMKYGISFEVNWKNFFYVEILRICKFCNKIKGCSKCLNLKKIVKQPAPKFYTRLQYISQFTGDFYENGIMPYNHFQRDDRTIIDFEALNNNTVGETSMTKTFLSPDTTFGCNGNENEHTHRPWGLCVNSRNQIIVSDRGNHRIQIYSRKGVLISSFGSFGSDIGQFNLPIGVCCNQYDEIIVSDKNNHRIQIFDRFGTFLRTFGAHGTGHGSFNLPWDVAVSSSGKILVGDSQNNRLQLFTSEGIFINSYLIEFSDIDNYGLPRGCTFTPDDNIIVTDFKNNKMYLFSSSLQVSTK